jgi:two-component system chemotaxis sensor kinase CheA
MNNDYTEEELQIFLEECKDQLQKMETALVDISEGDNSVENIDRIFRAAHTVKGNAGMIDFDDVVHFTHVSETLLDEAREGRVVLTDEIVNILFEVKDYILVLLEAAIYNKELDSDTKEYIDEIASELKKHIAQDNTNKNILSNDEENSTQNIQEYNEENVELKYFYIYIKLKDNFFDTGMKLVSLISYLKDLGSIDKIFSDEDSVPSIDDTDPTKSYMTFLISFSGDTDKEEISEIFEFVENNMTLEIFEKHDLKYAKTVAKKNDEFKNSFIKSGLYKREDLKEEEKKQHVVKNNSHNASSQKDSSNFLRIDSSKIDVLLNQISEMVIANSMIIEASNKHEIEEIVEPSILLTGLLEEIRNGIMSMRMVKVEDSFVKFRRIVSDIARKLGKSIEFEIDGGDSELDKSMVEKIFDPIVHMLRNSLDHGIETTSQRLAKGKNETGHISLRAYPETGMIVIEIEDDGQGLDKDKLLEKAINNKIVQDPSSLSDNQIYNLIFHPGFSTANEVTDISGRGVGMDVVRRNIEELKGSIQITTKKDKGTKFKIELPLTLAIIDGFLIRVGDTKYIIPLDIIQECIELDEQMKEQMNGDDFINLRGEALPLFDMKKYFNEEDSIQEEKVEVDEISDFENFVDFENEHRENIVIVKYGTKVMGLKVDELYGEHQTVIKTLGETFENIPEISGGSILGTGEVALMLDIPTLIQNRLESTI